MNFVASHCWLLLLGFPSLRLPPLPALMEVETLTLQLEIRLPFPLRSPCARQTACSEPGWPLGHHSVITALPCSVHFGEWSSQSHPCLRAISTLSYLLWGQLQMLHGLLCLPALSSMCACCSGGREDRVTSAVSQLWPLCPSRQMQTLYEC